MADKKAKGKGKKFLIIIGALAFVAVLIAVLVVVVPKGKTSAQKLNEVSTISMADNEDTKADYQQLVTKIETTAGVQYYSTEVKSLITLTNTIDNVIDYYNEYYPLATKTNKYARNINRCIFNIKSLQKQIIATQEKISIQTTSGYTHLQNTWIDFRAVYSQQLNEYKALIAQLNKMYHNCLGDALVVNDGSRLVLNAIDDYMYVIGAHLDKIVEDDVKGSKEAQYSLGQFKAKVDAFEVFVNKYLTTNRDFIIKCYTSTSTNYSQLNKFYTKLEEPDFRNIINSISYSSNQLKATYESDKVTDLDPETAVVQTLAKKFILGGV